MIRRAPRSTQDRTLFPYTTLFRSTMLRAALRLAGRPVPASPTELVRSAAALAGFPADALAPLVQHAMGGPVQRLGKEDPLAAEYLAAVASTAAYVNRLE